MRSRFLKFAAAAGFILAAAAALSSAAQNSVGGAFSPAFDYVVGGQWTWRSIAIPIVFEGTTDDAYQTSITVTNPTADRSWTLPDAAGTTFVGTTATQTLTNKTFTAPVLGAATGTSLATTGAITSSGASGGIGYATGAGCAVTQITNRTTGVTCTGISGQITTDTTSLAAEGTAKFTVTDTSVAIGDVVIVSQQSGSNSGGTIVTVTTVAAGSFQIAVHNGNVAAGTAETGAIIINFAVIKAVAS